MKAVCALLVAAASACATGSSSTTSGQATTSAAGGKSCASPMVSATAYRGTEVFEYPDSSNAPSVRLKEDTPLCASSNASGFGFRRVQLANGKVGYVTETNLSN